MWPLAAFLVGLAGLGTGLLTRRRQVDALRENNDWTGEALADRKRLDLVRDLSETRSLREPEPPSFMRLGRNIWGTP